MKTNRIIIYPKDIQRITGKSERYGRTVIKKIKQNKLKSKGQFVSLAEFAEFSGLSIAEIESYLLD